MFVVMSISSLTGATVRNRRAGPGSAYVDVRGDFEAQTQVAEVGIDPLHGISPRLVFGTAVLHLEARCLERRD
ncbi:hypothetical protein AO735_04585 [Pseudomonas sp. TTU2014-096BSC]|nr:hypothetical protein AO735_04585 [Pseudomonas sp. TTU2014-096BSC]